MILRTEIRRDYSTPDKWLEVEVQAPGINDPIGPTTETVTRRLRPLIEGETVTTLQEAGKFVVLAQANPYIWVTEE